LIISAIKNPIKRN